MSYITDLVLADRAELQAVADTDAPASRWPGISDIGFYNESPIVRLFCVLTGQRGATSLEAAEDVVLRDYAEARSSDGSWAFAFPQAMTELLAGLAGDSKTAILEEWRASDEVRDMKWTVDETTSIFQKVLELSTRAVQADRRVIWRTGE